MEELDEDVEEDDEEQWKIVTSRDCVFNDSQFKHVQWMKNKLKLSGYNKEEEDEEEEEEEEEKQLMWEGTLVKVRSKTV